MARCNMGDLSDITDIYEKDTVVETIEENINNKINQNEDNNKNNSNKHNSNNINNNTISSGNIDKQSDIDRNNDLRNQKEIIESSETYSTEEEDGDRVVFSATDGSTLPLCVDCNAGQHAFNQLALQRYLLHCAQTYEGGMRGELELYLLIHSIYESVESMSLSIQYGECVTKCTIVEFDFYLYGRGRGTQYILCG